MTFQWWDIWWAALAGGLICVDRVGAFQFKISRPIVAAPLVGGLLGHLPTGVILGGLLELVWVGRPPIGGRIPPHESLAAIVITAGVILAGAGVFPDNKEIIVLAVLLGLPLARLGALLEFRLRNINDVLAQKASQAVASGNVEKVNTINLKGILFSFLAETLFILVFTALITLLLSRMLPVNTVLPPSVVWALNVLFPFIPLTGVAGALLTINVSKSHYAFAASFLVLFVLLNI